MILVWAIVVTSCFFTLINRGQPLYAVSTGTSQGNLGGGAVNLPNLKAGEPLVATAGAEGAPATSSAGTCARKSGTRPATSSTGAGAAWACSSLSASCSSWSPAWCAGSAAAPAGRAPRRRGRGVGRGAPGRRGRVMWRRVRPPPAAGVPPRRLARLRS